MSATTGSGPFTAAPSDRPTSGTSFEAFAEESRGQMGAKRIGSLAIGISVIGIVLNQMDSISVFNSSGVIDVSSILSVAGDGLQLLVVGVIIAAAAVLLNLWSGF